MKALLACAAAALFVASGADATVYKQIYSGIVTDSDPTYTTDYDNVFGGGDLAGATFTATYLWDDTLGTITADATSWDLEGDIWSGTVPSPNLLTSLTINGHNFSYSSPDFAELYIVDKSYTSEVSSNTNISGYQLSLGLSNGAGHAPWATSPFNWAGGLPAKTPGGIYYGPAGGIFLSQGDELHLTANYYSIAPFVPGAPAQEPASWAMMLAGFGLVGGAMRARRRTQVRFA